jgi:predicted DNA-binding transcriptional regulator AlpA
LVAVKEVWARMWEDGERWRARTHDATELSAPSREECVRRLRSAAGTATLTIEVEPRLVGVAEAAAILGWDKRRIFTYLGRGAFPEPVALLASGRVWRRDDVEAFARTRTTRAKRPAT